MKKILLSAASAIILLAACNSNDEVAMSIDEDIPQVSNEFAMSNEEVTNLLNFFVNDGATTRSDAKNLTIKDYTVKNVEVNTEEKTEYIPIYEYTTVNEKGDEGYSIVVADSRIQKVLVQVEKGTLADTAKILPLKWYINSIPNMVTADLQKYNEKYADKPVTRSLTSYVETAYCFISTAWGQYFPYYTYCQNSQNVTCPAGCVPVAVAQIFAYHQIPASLNWSSILQYPNLSNDPIYTDWDEVATLIANLGTQMNINYTYNNSTIPDNSLIAATIRSYPMYCDNLYPFNLEEIISSLGNNRPVLLTGKEATDPNTGLTYGHTWVCDGWKRHHYDPDYYDYLDMNWGYDGYSNGFYYITSPMSFSVNGSTYIQNFKMITNIRKS